MWGRLLPSLRWGLPPVFLAAEGTRCAGTSALPLTAAWSVLLHLGEKSPAIVNRLQAGEAAALDEAEEFGRQLLRARGVPDDAAESEVVRCGRQRCARRAACAWFTMRGAAGVCCRWQAQR